MRVHPSVTFETRDHDNVLTFANVSALKRAYWLLEQGSNLQALRHLINSQARLPIPPSRIREKSSGLGNVRHLSGARAHEHEHDVACDDEVGLRAAAQQRQSGAAVRQREIDELAAVGALRLHRDVEELADRLIQVLQPQLRPDFLGAQLEAEPDGAVMNVGEFAALAEAERRDRQQDEIELLVFAGKRERRPAENFIG